MRNISMGADDIEGEGAREIYSSVLSKLSKGEIIGGFVSIPYPNSFIGKSEDFIIKAVRELSILHRVEKRTSGEVHLIFIFNGVTSNDSTKTLDIFLNTHFLNLYRSTCDNDFWTTLHYSLLLPSKHARRWYENAKSGKCRGAMYIEDIRDMYALDDDIYPRKHDLLKRLVYEPIALVNSITDISINYEYIMGRRRPVEGFVFSHTWAKSKNDNLFVIPRHKLQLEKILDQHLIPVNLQREVLTNSHLAAEILNTYSKIVDGRIRIRKSVHLYLIGLITNILKTY